MWGSPERQIGIVDYPGAQVACIMGLTDLFAIASGFALGERQLGDAALRVTHWKPVDSFDANLSCVYDSAPHGSPQLAALIEDGADRCGLCLADHEHPGSMGDARRGRQAGTANATLRWRIQLPYLSPGHVAGCLRRPIAA